VDTGLVSQELYLIENGIERRDPIEAKIFFHLRNMLSVRCQNTGVTDVNQRGGVVPQHGDQVLHVQEAEELPVHGEGSGSRLVQCPGTTERNNREFNVWVVDEELCC
jgi:hypothetical protein